MKYSINVDESIYHALISSDGVSFIEFERLWDSGGIEKKYSYEVESDFIDWEMLEGEKGELLKLIAELKIYKRG